jgi:hypothetical protein
MYDDKKEELKDGKKQINMIMTEEALEVQKMLNGKDNKKKKKKEKSQKNGYYKF